MIWTTEERSAWAWLDPQLPSEWCDSGDLYIPANSINPEPGPYSLSRTPYWREVIDLVADPTIEQIWVYKPTQVGFTRLMINLICYFADQAPGALGLLMPDEDSVDEIFTEELQPTFRQSPVMKSHLPRRAWDDTKQEIWLDTMPVFGLYAGSVQRLARRSLRYVIGDEINKYRPFKQEASPIQLLLKRISNWGTRAKALFGSTPTTEDGNITQGFLKCTDKRRLHVPCPRCGFYQQMHWSQVRGFRDAPGENKHEKAEWIRLHKPCYFECVKCRGRMEETEKHRSVAECRWVSDGQQCVEGKLVGERPFSTKVGLHLNSLASPWLSMSQLAAEFVEAEGDIDKSQDFRNARLALEWKNVAKQMRPSTVRDKKAIAPVPGLVPKWAISVYATFDTQKDWFAGVIRAWGWGLKSQLLWHGECHTGFDEVFEIGLNSRWQVDGGGIISPKCLLIDSGGDRTDEVYDFALRDPRIMPTKGSSTAMRKLWSDSEVKPGVWLRVFDTNHFKSSLWNLIHDPDPTKWLPHRDVSEQYCLEMASEHLVIDPKTKKRTWKETGNVRNEAWDMEVLQRLCAEMDNIAAAPAPESEKPKSHRDAGMEYTNPFKK